MAVIAHRMRKPLACYLFPRLLVPRPGAGDYLRSADEGEQAVRGSGDEYDDLMFFSPVGLLFSICYGLFAL